MNIHTRAWGDELLGFFGVPRPMLPEIRPCAERYGEMDADAIQAAMPSPSIGGGPDRQRARHTQRDR